MGNFFAELKRRHIYAGHCLAEQTCWGGMGSVMPCIAICGVICQRSPVAWAAKPANEPSDRQAPIATRYEILRLFMS